MESFFTKLLYEKQLAKRVFVKFTVIVWREGEGDFSDCSEFSFTTKKVTQREDYVSYPVDGGSYRTKKTYFVSRKKIEITNILASWLIYLCDKTVAPFLQILEVREAVLERIFKVRKEEVKICPDQNIRQEEMLNTIRFGQAVL